MKEIELTKGYKALVDDEDYDFLMQWEWHIGSTGYAVRNQHKGEYKELKYKTLILMHNVILEKKDGYEVDHLNRIKTDNRKSNLELKTRQHNNLNTKIRITNKSGYRGVSWFKRGSKWRATITVNGKQKHLGYFDSKKDAARAYNQAALTAFGKFANLNEVD